MIKLQYISKTYASGQVAFQCDNLTIPEQGRVGIAGETGSGKSTLLKIIGGLEKPDEGKALYKSHPIYPKLDRLIPGHPEMSYLSQMFELPKFITVLEFLDSRFHGKEEIVKVADICRIADFLQKDTSELSGGERQRVGLAKVLLKQPSVILLDEPFSNLDPHHKRIIKEVIADLSDQIEAAVLMVSHDPSDLLPWATEILVLKEGQIVQQGKPTDIYNQPENQYVAGLFGEYQLINGEKWNKENNLITRPEQFSIGSKGLEAIVKSVRFHGSYDLLILEASEELIKVKSETGIYHQGDKIFIRLSL